MSSRPMAIVVLAAAAVIGSARTSTAAGIFLESVIGMNFGCGSPNPCPQGGGLANFVTATTANNLLSVNQTFTNPSGPNGPTTYTAQAQSDYGVLHAAASASFNIGTQAPTAPDSRFVVASSSFGEFMTVNSPLQDGQPGFLTISFHLDGFISETGVGNAFAFIGVQAGADPDNPETIDEHFFPFESSFDGTIIMNPLEITYGQAFYLKVVLATVAGTAELCATCPVGIAFGDKLGSGTGNALFFNTLEVSGFLPTTEAGAFVADAQFVGESGAQYDFNGVVPEPGSLLLFGTGLAMVARRWRRAQ